MLDPNKLPDRMPQKVKVAENGCWLWTGATLPNGYGQKAVRKPDGRLTSTTAHRVAYEALIGPIPGGLSLDHLCHNADPLCSGGPTCHHRRCVNPTHLEPVTPLENQRRSPLTFTFANLSKTHCPNGHPFDDANTYRSPGSTNRLCWTCSRANAREYQRRVRAKRKQQ